MARSTALLSFLLLMTTLKVSAQFADSLQLEVGTVASVASREYQPLWLIANKFGTIADRKSDLSSHLSIANIHRFAGSKKIDITYKPYYISYGASVYNNNHFNETFITEAYLKTGYKKLEFRAGRFLETTGEMNAEVSSGSLGISGNALPIPKIGFAFTDYVPVPFTRGFVQIRGQISHGWFGTDRYMKDAFYHEKIFYMQLGKKKFKLYGGVQHFVEWGGRRGRIQLEKSWKGFLDVLLVRASDDGSVGTNTNGILPNRPGDQRGLVEAGFKFDAKTVLIHGYQQTLFETGRDVDIRNDSRIIGLQVASKKSTSILQNITVELLFTKNMLDFVEIRDRQSFYNNGYYKTGWEYKDNIVGTPLFINRVRGSKYFSSITPYNWNAPDNTIISNTNIINNRVVDFHLGMLLRFSKVLDGKTMVTYTNNYGTYNTASPFVPNKKQLYTMQQLQYKSPVPGLIITAAVGFDAGDLSDNTGFLFGVKKQFNHLTKAKVKANM